MLQRCTSRLGGALAAAACHVAALAGSWLHLLRPRLADSRMDAGHVIFSCLGKLVEDKTHHLFCKCH
jgi:hypothetical protein